VTLTEITEQYRKDLFDDFLPFMDRFVIDFDRGGFCCHCDRDGTRLSDRKDSWYEGRGIWIYSCLYEHYGRNPRHLEIARKTLDAVLAARPKDDPRWPRVMNGDYSVVTPDREIYGTLFVAEGLLAYASASGEREWRECAVGIVRDMIDVYERPDYVVDMTGYLGPGNEPLRGARVQGVPMVLLRFATQLLRQGPDAEFEALATRSVQILLEKHWNPAFGLNLELLTYDYQFPDGAYSQFAYTGHTLEAMWMVMDEAARRGDEALFELAAERFRRHVDVSWDGVYGGVFRGLRHVDRNEWLLDRVLWPQEEVLIGCMMLLERGDEWAARMFRKMYGYVQQHYPLKKHGLPLWINAADRKVTFEPHYNRVENYHHPRHLMMNLQMLERMSPTSRALLERC